MSASLLSNWQGFDSDSDIAVYIGFAAHVYSGGSLGHKSVALLSFCCFEGRGGFFLFFEWGGVVFVGFGKVELRWDGMAWDESVGIGEGVLE